MLRTAALRASPTGSLLTTSLLRSAVPLSRTYATTEDNVDTIVKVLKERGLEDKITVRGLANLAKENKEVAKAVYDVSKTSHEAIKKHPEQIFPPVRVTVSGAAGAIGYSLIFRIASGELLGDVPIILQLLEIPEGMKALEGVAMELKDCAFPNLKNVVISSQPEQAFEGADFAFLVGAKPRGKGMERADLLKGNAAIFAEQGKALNKTANRDDIKIVVVGNPANTNALIASCNAPDIHPSQFSAMTRLDHNRGLSLLSEKTGADVSDISRFAIWGNHSSTQYPDVNHTLINGKWAREILDEAWIKNTFIPQVQQRGAAIIAARGSSSAASAAGAAIDHMRDWEFGTQGKWVSMGVWTGSEGGNYGTSKDIYYSYPVVVDEYGRYAVVENIPIDPFSAQRMQITNDELVAEKKECGALAQRK